MAAGFVALNDTFGTVFDASRAEAATPAMAQERANALKDQFIMDMHTHFLRDDTRLANFVRSREAVGKAGWNPALVDKPQTLDDLKFNNYFKEIYLDSDTKIALISSSPSEIPRDWFLTNEMMIEARDKVNKEAGSRRMFAHAIFTPGWDGWLEQLEGSLAAQAGIDQGLYRRRQHQQGRGQASLADGRREGHLQGLRARREARHQERLRAQGPVPAGDRASAGRTCSPTPTSRRRQGGEGLAAAQLRHLSRRLSPRRRRPRRGRLEGVRADRPRVVGVATSPRSRRNTASPTSTPTSGNCSRRASSREPQLGAALMGIMGKGMGYDRVVWGTDAVWTGSPQWQIEALRRLEIPEDMQKKYGFKPLGAGRRPDQDRDLRRHQCQALQLRHRPSAPTSARTATASRVMKEEYEKQRPGAHQPALRLCERAGRLVGVCVRLTR